MYLKIFMQNWKIDSSVAWKTESVHTRRNFKNAKIFGLGKTKKDSEKKIPTSRMANIGVIPGNINQISR